MYRAPACQGGDAVLESGQAQNAAGRRQAVNTAAADPQLGLSGQQGPELLQEDFTPEKLAKTAVELLQPERQAQLQSDLAYMKHRLGEPGAVNRVAQLILKITEERK